MEQRLHVTYTKNISSQLIRVSAPTFSLFINSKHNID